MLVPFFIVERQAGVDVLASLRRHAAPEADRPGGVACLQQDVRVVELARDPEQFERDLLCARELPEGHVERPQTRQRWYKVNRAFESPGDLKGPLDRGANFRRGSGINAHQCRAEQRKDGKFGALTVDTIEPRRVERQRAPEVLYRLPVRCAAHCLLAGVPPMHDRGIDKPGLGAVAGQHFGLCLGGLRESLLVRSGNARVQLLPGSAQHDAVGGVRHQSVLEGVIITP